MIIPLYFPSLLNPHKRLVDNQLQDENGDGAEDDFNRHLLLPNAANNFSIALTFSFLVPDQVTLGG